jgi:ABC-type Fe3+-hydroxamate transport system substrate-binding protein
MIQGSYRFVQVHFRMVAALLALLVASCAQPSSSPEQVQSSNPSVTYKYHNDQELLQVNQSAATFCSQYQGIPQATNFTPDPNGGNDVVFQCVPATAPGTSQMQVTQGNQGNPNLTYNYGSDAQLLGASRNAQTYCMNNGSSQVSSNITTNTDGTKTVTFQCNRP